MIKSIAIVILSALIIVSAFKIVSKSKSKHADADYKLECSYMAYACGECTAQYRVKRILAPSKPEYKDLVGSDIKVVFKDTVLEKRVYTLTSKCAICYNYYLTGSIEKKERDEYYTMKVDSCTFSLKDSSCCDIKD